MGIYEMLSGLPPFYTQDRKQLFDRIRNAQLTFPTYMSSNARRICTELMRRDPNDRLGAVADADDVKQHKFWGSTDWQKLYNKEVPPPFVPASAVNPTEQPMPLVILARRANA